MNNENRTVAVIGAGPAGIYAARKLRKSGFEVVILNRDIRPGGLAEYGIFHDKYKMKAGLRKQFTKILDTDGIHYRGNVTVGTDGVLTVEDLDELGFDAVLVAVGAQGIKWLEIEGSDANHIYDAKQVVYHVNGLPSFSENPIHKGQHLVVIGAGNVAVDVTHWAVQQNVPEITWLVRRGPNQVKYTGKEIGYVGAHVDRDQLREEIQRIGKQLVQIGEDPEETLDRIEAPLGDTPIPDSQSVIRMRFACQANRIHADARGNIASIEVVENELYLQNDRIGCRSTTETTTIPADTLVFCVGDAIDPNFGLELDEWGSYALEKSADGEPSYRIKDRPGWFAAGWARIASDGLVGKARKDAEAACVHVEDWLNTRNSSDTTSSLSKLDAKLRENDVNFVDWAHFQRVRARENARAEADGLPDFRFTTNAEMLAEAGLSNG